MFSFFLNNAWFEINPTLTSKVVEMTNKLQTVIESLKLTDFTCLTCTIRTSRINCINCITRINCVKCSEINPTLTWKVIEMTNKLQTMIKALIFKAQPHNPSRNNKNMLFKNLGEWSYSIAIDAFSVSNNNALKCYF